MVDFRKELLSQNSVNSLKEVIRNLIPPNSNEKQMLNEENF